MRRKVSKTGNALRLFAVCLRQVGNFGSQGFQELTQFAAPFVRDARVGAFDPGFELLDGILDHSSALQKQYKAAEGECRVLA